jgi:DNA mismatch endonuclease (patch repair protein)
MADHATQLGLPASSFASSPAVRSRMQAQRTRDTKPEVELRRQLHRLGLRYRLETQIVPGTRRRVDISFPSAKVAVMVDGCFWHGCPDHGAHQPSVNQWYWPAKIVTNQQRDTDTDERLRASGWEVIRIWEHQDAAAAAAHIAAVVRDRRVAR